MRYLACLLVLITIYSCNETQEPASKMYPSDYLFAQRSFPHGMVDVKAYQATLQQRMQIGNGLRSFDKPWESHGPTNFCGRITDVEMPEDGIDQTVYAGSASGGVFKSEDLGDTWRPVFDAQPTMSIGDIDISKKNPQTIYVGTGESNAGGGSLAYDGLGVFRSDDGGENWQHRGLENAGSIGKVVLDPNDDNRVYVAAMGSLFANDSNGGIYRTSDGGEEWDQVLFLSDSTGGIDMAVHPQDGDVVYAAMWERIRRPHNRQYGGATSGLYKTIDGGDTWIELTKGLPTASQDKGRIGIAISRSNPDILYAFFANAEGRLNGVYKTTDAGDSWVRKNDEGITNVSFFWWFGRIFIHPNNPDEVYVTSITMSRTIDGGETWQPAFFNAHVDQHSMYIHPTDKDLVFNGNDGGVYKGIAPDYLNSDYKNGMSNFQFYTCEIDPNNPDILYGGTQDNGTNKKIGETTDNWSFILGGDGFRVLVDPTDSDIVYAESQYGSMRVSYDGGQNFSSARNGLSGDFNWNTPIAMDPNNTQVLYTGAQQLFRTINRADSWEVISQELVNPDNPTGNLTFGSLTTIDVASTDSKVIYIGTDDGNVWVTRDAGQTYDNISEGLPKRWITSVAHDPHSEGGVYITVSGFRFGESSAQVFYSDSYGDNWQPIGDGLPDIPVNDIIVDGLVPDQIYVATDVGVYYSENQGAEWKLLGTDMPILPVTDLDIHNDSRLLAAATYGRGMYTYNLPNDVSTDELVGNEVVVSPNPTHGRLSIGTTQKVKSLELMDMHGRVVRTTQSSNSMNVESCIQGTYLLRINWADGAVTVKKVMLIGR